jgi:ketosteroid isomerase-like protein
MILCRFDSCLCCSFRYLLSIILTVAVISATPLSAQNADVKVKASEVERDKTAVADLEEEWLDALNKVDVNAIADIVADDFVRPAADSGQFMNKADLLRFYRSHLSPQASGQRRIEGMTVTLYGSTALARGVLITTNSEGQVIRKLLFTDVFVRRATKWQAVSAQENAVTLAQVPAH